MFIKKGHDPMEMTQKEDDETIKAKFLKKIDFVKSYLIKDWTGRGAWYPYIIENKNVLDWYLRPVQIPANDFGFPSEIRLGGMIVKLIEDVQSDLKLLNPIPKYFSEDRYFDHIKWHLKQKIPNKVRDYEDRLIRFTADYVIVREKKGHTGILSILKILENFVSEIFLFQTTIGDSCLKNQIMFLSLN
jgi:hypothetical protein